MSKEDEDPKPDSAEPAGDPTGAPIDTGQGNISVPEDCLVTGLGANLCGAEAAPWCQATEQVRIDGYGQSARQNREITEQLDACDEFVRKYGG